MPKKMETKFGGALRISILSDKNGDTVDIMAIEGDDLGQRDLMVFCLKPLADAILAFHNCGCEGCDATKRVAEGVKAVLEREDIGHGKTH